MSITAHVRLEHPEAHHAQFTLEVDHLGADPFDLVLPAWVPGSYHILDYAKDVGALTASLPRGGPPRKVERIDKARWRIHPDGASEVEVRYSVYGHALVTEGLDVSDTHLFLNAALCLPYVDGRQSEPYDVVLHLPAGWTAYSELPEVASAPPRLHARNYDELVDSPIDCGRPTILEFLANGKPQRIVLCGDGGNFEAHRLEEDLRKIVEAANRVFGEPPVPHYTFFVHLTDVPDGGLEHVTSNSVVVPRSTFRPASVYRRFLLLESHEYFHAFNVKRIRPAAILPFDYTREMYTSLLWAMEGTTDYYGHLVLRRAGLVSGSKFLEGIASSAKDYLAIPGRLRRSLEESSFLAWIDLYKGGEDAPNRSVSYYLKGLLVSFCLDLEIRARTENRSSLDAVMRALWERFGKPGHGIGEAELLAVASEVAGIDLAPFFADYVAGTTELDLDVFARHAGLAFGPKPKPRSPEDDVEAGYLGITYENRDGFTVVKSVRDGGPGRRAGISPGDEIVAFDRVKVTHENFPKWLAKAPPGTEVTLSLFRRGYLTDVQVTTGTPPPETYAFTPLAAASPLQRAIYESWLGAPWEPAKPEAPPSTG